MKNLKQTLASSLVLLLLIHSDTGFTKNKPKKEMISTNMSQVLTASSQMNPATPPNGGVAMVQTDMTAVLNDTASSFGKVVHLEEGLYKVGSVKSDNLNQFYLLVKRSEANPYGDTFFAVLLPQSLSESTDLKSRQTGYILISQEWTNGQVMMTNATIEDGYVLSEATEQGLNSAPYIQIIHNSRNQNKDEFILTGTHGLIATYGKLRVQKARHEHFRFGYPLSGLSKDGEAMIAGNYFITDRGTFQIGGVNGSHNGLLTLSRSTANTLGKFQMDGTNVQSFISFVDGCWNKSALIDFKPISEKPGAYSIGFHSMEKVQKKTLITRIIDAIFGGSSGNYSDGDYIENNH